MIVGLKERVFELFISFFNSIESNTFSLESYLFLHFTILGIIVTLVAITTSLTKEIRQDLIWDYYLKTKLVIAYYCLISFSFISTIIVYAFDLANLSFFIFIMLFLSFVSTIVFIPSFLWRLKREWFYKKIIKEFKHEIEKEKN
ncbi:MAG: hypothetical protein KKC19_02340 [Nanoarchaeota archaeon]|nr:hypothetical protein [Nanoarchaeota archaeon]